jgi:transcriptional regulator with XRE-family HTH domain
MHPPHAGVKKIFRGIPMKPATNWKAVGKRLRELRGFEMTQKQLARELQVSQGQLSRYEKGESEIGADVLLRISRRFEKTIEWLLTGENPSLDSHKQ